MTRNARRRGVAALVVLVILVALVADEWSSRSSRIWWASHALTADIVGSLLVVAVSALIFDEVTARRKREDRSASVAVQAVIVYSQARRAYNVVMAGDDSEDEHDAGEELRALTTMLLPAAPQLFDDPQARLFLEQVQKIAASMFRKVLAAADAPLGAEARDQLTAELARLDTSFEPLRLRLPLEENGAFDVRTSTM